MPTMTTSTQEQALKLFYLDGFRNQINEEFTEFYKKMEVNTSNVEGKKVNMNLRYGRNGGIGNRAETANLPTPNPRKSIEASFPTKNIFANVEISEKAMKASKTSKGAYANLLTKMFEEALVDAKEEVNRQLYGTAQGTLSTVKTAFAAPATTVAVNGNIERFAEGKYIDIYTVTAGAITATRTTANEILSIDRVNKTITVATSIAAVSVGDVIVTAGNFGQELTGLGQVFEQNTSIYGVDRNTYKFLNSKVNNIGGALDLITLEQAVDESKIATSEKPSHILASLDAKRQLSSLYQVQQRFNNTQEYNGGQVFMMFQELPVVPDRYQVAGTMDILAIDTFKRYTLSDWDWLEEDGAMLSRVPNKAAYGATLSTYLEVACEKLPTQSRLTGIQEA